MDTRTRAEKLAAMAADPGASEGERDNARRLLATMGASPPPPKPPTAVGASPEWDFEAFSMAVRRAQRDFENAQARNRARYGASFTTNSGGGTTNIVFTVGGVKVDFR